MRGSVTENKTGSGLGAAFLAAAVLAIAGVVFYFSTTVNAAQASGPKPDARQALSSRALSLPMFFEPNQGQTAPQVKFLARGAGYGLFLTADEAVLELQHSAVSRQPSANSSRLSALSSQRASGSVIRMHLDGANSSARVSGASPLTGKSNYFIGNDPSKWRHDIPQFARVEYQAVYPGVDLVYYGDQGQLEYDFRVAPAADPNQIALSFQGASARINSGDSGDSGDLVLSTANGDVRFHAPRVYQQDGNIQKTIAGSFRQIAENKIGFAVGAYDHSRELVIDPVLTYSTYLGGENTESSVHVAIGPDDNIYLVGSTNSPNFPLPPSPPADPPVQSELNPASGATNIFIAVINPNPPPFTSQLVYATYLGGSGIDSAAGVAVHTALDQLTTGFDVFVAGSTTSTDFPVKGAQVPFESGPGPDAGFHGFLARVNVGTITRTSSLRYSTYLAGSNATGNATDFVTGLAIDSAGNAYVTGNTTSSNPASDGFPANPNGYQTSSNSPGNPQFFASMINTTYSGSASMIYSTYFGGGNFAPNADITENKGGGIAVDPTASNVNMYITGTTNMLPNGLNGGLGFPLFNAWQACLDEPGNHGKCNLSPPPTQTDAFVAKINPNQPGSLPIYSTYMGGSDIDSGLAIAVDTSGNAYVTGSTSSSSWGCSCSGFQSSLGGSGATNAYIAKLTNLSEGVYPLTYFTYLGGSGSDSGNDIKVDSLQAAHVTGSTDLQSTPTFPITNAFQPTYGGGASDAFVALISTTAGASVVGDYVSYLGGSGEDEGTGIAIDVFGATYVAGDTQSTDFPTVNPLQPCLNNTASAPPCPTSSAADAFVSEIGAVSKLVVSKPTTSPSPSPVAAGTQVAFTFDIVNNGPDNASNVTFYASVPSAVTNAAAKVTSGSGTCGTVSGTTIVCNIPTLTETACIPTPTTPCSVYAGVEVDVTPPITANLSQVAVSGYAVANGAVSVFNKPSNTLAEQVSVVDFSINAKTLTPSINAGDTATIQVAFCPTIPQLGYSATVTPSQSISPSMVTATTPTFSPTSVTLSLGCADTTLSIATVARPVPTASLLRRGSFYAAWLPIGGLSLVGLGIGAGRKRRRWLAALVLGLIAGAILLQSGCGSSSSSTTPGGGTQAAVYTITITGSAATGASHNTQAQLTVH